MRRNLLNFVGRRRVKECKSDNSRQEISKDYLLAQIGFGTAENEPSKVWQLDRPTELDS